MKATLLLLALLGPQTFAEISLDPLTSIKADPCLKTVEKAVEAIIFSSKGAIELTSAHLLSANKERVYSLKFYGLVGSFQLTLDNESNNRCFLILQKYLFN